MIPLQFALRRRMIGIQESVCFVNIPQQMIYATGEYYWGDVTHKGKTVRGPETLRVQKRRYDCSTKCDSANGFRCKLSNTI